VGTARTDVELSLVEHIAINVHDVDRAVKFYRDVLGLPFLFQVPNMAFVQCGEVRLMLGIPSEPEFDHPSSIIYFRVADIEAVRPDSSSGSHAPQTVCAPRG
jgi:methylmalonyl-CoA/ethylmalonyl-CoA epimerase